MIVITRPFHQAQALAARLKAQGKTVMIVPTLEILPAMDEKPLREAMENLNQYRLLIFVSANAVNYALAYSHPLIPTPVIAVGPATAQALQKSAAHEVLIPLANNSEGILALPALQNIGGFKIAIFCGENSRPLLKTTLVERGAMVDEIICYRRQCPVMTDPQRTLIEWQNAQVNLIISTSLESLENLWRLFVSIDSNWLCTIGLLVISPAMAVRAKALGFQRVIVAADASDAAVCAAVAS